jgi:PKD repeat protein
VLDNFDRANGAPGANWADPVYGLTGVSILNNQLAHTSGYKAPYWNTTTFGPDQEAYVTIATLATGDPGHDLMLKVQGTGWSSAHVEVRYDDEYHRVGVHTYTPGSGWVTRGAFIPVTYVSGDQLGARAYANGTVEVYKSGVKIGQVSLGNWAFAAAGGKVGLTLDGTIGARFDNFGGGNVGGAPPANTPPVANASGTPTSGTSPLTVNFSSAGSSDPDNDPLTFSWVFGDGTPNSTAANPSHVYAGAGNYTAVLTVSDGRGGSTQASVAIAVAAPGNQQPVAAASGTPTGGVAPLTVAFSSAGSSDPDGDPLSYVWVFGDGTPNGTTANPSHVYASAGNYTAVLTVSDGRGGSAQASVAIAATPAGGGGFPSTAVLDNFNRANGALGSNWVDPAYTLNGASIVSNMLQHTCCYQAPVWSPTSFGPDQEAFVTIATLAAGDPGHDLMLKVQGNSWNNAHIEVRYDDIYKHIGIHTYDPAVGGWITRGSFIPVTFVSGDQLGARAKGNGIVEVFKNGVKLGEASMGTWAYATQGGRIGLTLDGTVGARFENFGGGNVAPAAMGPVALQLDIGQTEFAPALDLPSRLSLGNAYPNPTDGKIGVELALPGSANVGFAVYDIQGRSVWRQDDRIYPAGRAMLSWGGEELGGGRAAPGIYLARVLVDGQGFTRRFVIVR